MLNRNVALGTSSVASSLYAKYASCIINKISFYFDHFSYEEYLVKSSSKGKTLKQAATLDPDAVKQIQRASDDVVDFMFLRTYNDSTVVPSLDMKLDPYAKLIKLRKNLKLKHSIIPRCRKTIPFKHDYISGSQDSYSNVLELMDASRSALASRLFFGIPLSGNEPAAKESYQYVVEFCMNVRMYVKWTFSGVRNNQFM